MRRAGRIRIGISGWTYPPWRGVFYPPKLPHAKELAFAGERLGALEINGTFYGLQKPDSFAKWAAQVPDDFVFTVKAPRFITHIRRLRDIAAPVANFIASGVLRLGPKLGPILWQFPPNLSFDAELWEAFLALLPHDTEAAAALAAHHDARLDGRDWTKTDAQRPLCHAVEIRHDSFACGEFVDMLRAHDVALVCADTVEWPRLMDLTSDFVYCRLHGSGELYVSGYDDAALDLWAARSCAWAQGKPAPQVTCAAPAKGHARPRDVFLFFDNTEKIRAPANAQALAARVERLAG